MNRFFSILSLLFGTVISQINPVRDPVITFAPTVRPVFTVNPIVPVRTINPGIVTTTTTSFNTFGTSTTDTGTTTVTESSNDGTDVRESGDNLTLVYTLVPIGILGLLLVLLCIRRKRAINNNNVVNIDLNIENVLPSNSNSNTIVKQPSIDSNRFSNHIYEEVNYEARYEMPTIGGNGAVDYENVFTGDKGADNEYGKQVTTIV